MTKQSKYEITIKGKSANFEQVQITSPNDAARYARNFYHDDLLLYESMFIILLDSPKGWSFPRKGTNYPRKGIVTERGKSHPLALFLRDL